MSTERFAPPVLLGLMLLLAAGPAASDTIIDSKHNLALPGTGTSEICIFCHTPHNAGFGSPLWNRAITNRVYVPYTSSSLEATPGQPTHASKLCLSCHDGTIGLGQMLRGSVPSRANERVTGRANLTTDLSDDHPVSILFDSALAARDGQLRDPATLSGRVRVDRYGEVQCTSCHDAHSSPFPKLLHQEIRNSALCKSCHDRDGWDFSSHATSNKTWKGSGLNPWPHTGLTTVAANGCLNCHASHGAGVPERLLNYAPAEETCLACHNGSVAEKDIESQLQMPFGHNVRASSGEHRPDEDHRIMPRHVECQDCHNPHAARAGSQPPPYAGGPLAYASGVTATGTFIRRVNYEYETCFRCHGDSPNVPSPEIQRQIFQPNIRLKFEPSAPSMHPVTTYGKNPFVPSLIPPLTVASQISCTDCHNSDNGPGVGGNGPNGPHGSRWKFLLERQYITGDDVAESYQVYSLCYKCHDRTSILGDRSFPHHNLHISTARTPCSVCHDPHGISPTQGNVIRNSHLINFDTSVVQRDPVTSLLQFEDLGQGSGQCYLMCHGVVHSPKTY